MKTISTQQLVEDVEALRHMGLEVLEESSNRIRIKLPKEGNRNHVGGIYAGTVFTLAEIPFGLLFVKRFSLSDMYPVVGEVTIRFQALATSPLFVELCVSDEEWDEIERATRAEGKVKIVRNVEVKDEEGHVNAIVAVTYFSVLAKS
ncbi:MAG: DUF4442 domain-containing protein [Desulfuromonadales bacterium]|nr:DUF4442 domain-containing protein [Desulfuromonadales bacterium]